MLSLKLVKEPNLHARCYLQLLPLHSECAQAEDGQCSTGLPKENKPFQECRNRAVYTHMGWTHP